MGVLRIAKANVPSSAPPAIWAAFLRQGRWKDWVLVFQALTILLLIGVCFAAVKTDPDVVLVTPEGKSTYVRRQVAGAALIRFLAEQRALPSDATVVHFVGDFLTRALAINSSTIEEAWPMALAQMAPPLRARMEKESRAQRLVETYKAAQVRMRLDVQDVVLTERTPKRFVVRAELLRTGAPLLGEPSEEKRERLSVELVLLVTPRSEARPDGLEVEAWQVTALQGNDHENAARPSP